MTRLLFGFPGEVVSHLTGVKVLEPVRYTLTEEVTPRLFWWPKREFYIESDMGMRVGPFPNRAAAVKFKADIEDPDYGEGHSL